MGGENLEALTSQMSTLADGFENRDASPLIRAVTASGGDGPTDDEVAALNASLFARAAPDVLAAVARSLPALYEVPGERRQTARYRCWPSSASTTATWRPSPGWRAFCRVCE